MQNENVSKLFMPIFYIVMGIIFCIPSLTGSIFAIILTIVAVLILIGSILILVKGIQANDESKTSKIVTGIIGIIVAILFPTLAWTLFFVFEIVFGVILIIYGAYSILVSIMSKSLISIKVVSIIVSTIVLTVGALLIAHALKGNPTISYIIGGVLIFDGGIDLLAYYLNKNKNKSSNEEKVIDAEIIEDNKD